MIPIYKRKDYQLVLVKLNHVKTPLNPDYTKQAREAFFLAKLTNQSIRNCFLIILLLKEFVQKQLALKLA